ncbi:MAG: hypothetical protein RLZZ298_1487 [Pseudomonadota bacterium]|jgi:hypothetical protein
MRIAESSVALSASHEAERSKTSEMTIESNFRQVFESLASTPDDSQQAALERVTKLLESLLESILAAIEGKKGPENLAACDAPPKEAVSAKGGREMSWHCKFSETISESEKTTVCGSGKVKTCDGKEIDFNYAVDMAREFKSEKVYEDSGSVVLRDPLVLSFDGKASELTDQRQSFDLDSDGKLESIPGLAASSGFLVFDRNGSELFGAKSGNGFSELADLDSDHNGWIDEGDSVFSQLAVWSGDSWSSLAGRGVGALYTGAVDAPFSLKNSANGLLGEIRAAGVYLNESGSVGSLQQVDLAVSALPDGAQQPENRQQLAT